MYRERRLTLSRALMHLLIAGMALFMLIPLFWLLCAAFKDEDMFSVLFWSPHPTLSNFVKLLNLRPTFLRYVLNSFFLASAVSMTQLFFSSLAGFALAKYRFRGRGVLMAIMLATMMIPGQVLLAPVFELICHLRLTDTYMGIIIPGSVSVFGIFLFRQSMRQLPDELIEAARIDGCSEFRIFWEVALPLTRPMIGAFILIAFMGNWNSFIWPQIILHNAQRFTLPVALAQMRGAYFNEYGMLMAGTLLSIVPPMILFFILQKEFISGLTSGAVKA
jgi:ABC-type glycerol-3-phosphate transport system permease component